MSTDPNRFLIGDDEHGWDEDGIFNLEGLYTLYISFSLKTKLGGCYAKTINLSEENEPDIYRAIRPGAMLENVHIDDLTKRFSLLCFFCCEDKLFVRPNFYNITKTENGRVSYPLDHIPNYEPSSMGAHPLNIIFLTCDAFGVLPPVSRLTVEQALYHFLSGYTAKVAGTERGVTEPQATFSAGFGAAFLTLHPTRYADLLKKKLMQHHSKLYLVNTGWIGGAHGVGKRMSIKSTRACIDAILDGSINESQFVQDPVFGVQIPTSLKGVPPEVLDPRQAWTDPVSKFHLCYMLIIQFIAIGGLRCSKTATCQNVRRELPKVCDSRLHRLFCTWPGDIRVAYCE